MLIPSKKRALHKWPICIALIFIVLTGAGLLMTAPVLQQSSYHLLADKRSWLSIPNFANFISNLPFAFIGFAGLFYILRIDTETSLSWLVFFIGLILVAAGSSYYHWNPNNETLVWDRLPMTLCFMSLLVALISENISSQLEKPLLPIALFLGVSSIIYWHFTEDLRFYAIIQFGSLVALPLILYFYQSPYSHRYYLVYGLLFYFLAKILELNDNRIYGFSQQLISGHTAKHLFAAAGVYSVYLMLKKRTPTKL